MTELLTIDDIKQAAREGKHVALTPDTVERLFGSLEDSVYETFINLTINRKTKALTGTQVQEELDLLEKVVADWAKSVFPEAEVETSTDYWESDEEGEEYDDDDEVDAWWR